jgi:hypothetical protein
MPGTFFGFWAVGHRMSANFRRRQFGGSVFVGQHDGDDALSDVWVGRIGRMHGQRGIEVVDLEKDRVAVGFERAKVMFFVWVVGVAKVVVHFDCLDDARDSRIRALNDTLRHNLSEGHAFMTPGVAALGAEADRARCSIGANQTMQSRM